MKAMRCLRRRLYDVVYRLLAATPRHPVGAPEVSTSAPLDKDQSLEGSQNIRSSAL